MLLIFRNYLLPLIHPFKFQMYIRRGIPITGYEFEANEGFKIRKFEAILISWIFVMLKAIVELTILYFTGGLLLGAFETMPFELREMLYDHLDLNSFFFVWISLGVILYPLAQSVKLVIREWFLSIISLLTFKEMKDEKVDECIQQMTLSTLSAHALSFVPIFGEFLYWCSDKLILYAGFRENFSFSKPMSFVAIFLPQIFFIFALIIFIVFGLFLSVLFV